MEGPGPVPVPALPRRHHRPAGQRPVRPAHRPGGVRRPRLRGRHGGRDGRGRRGPRRAGGHLRERLAGDAGRVAARRAGPGRGRVRAVALRQHAAAAVPGRGRRALRGRAAVVRGLDDGQPALPPEGLAAVLRLLLRPDAVRTALDQAAGGHPRVDRRHDGAGAARGPGRRQVPRGHGGHGGAAARDRPAGAGDPGHRGPLPAARPGPEPRRVDRWRAAGAGGLRAPADGPRPDHGQPRHQGLRGPGHRCARRRASPRWRHEASAAGAVPLLSHRARSRAPRPGHRRRDARAAARPRGPVADPVAGGGVPRAARRGRAPGLAPAGQRVGALRVGVGRARPARVPGRAPDGRGAGQQLHGVRRPGGAGVVRRLARATRPGTSTTSCTRTPSSSGRRSSG